MESFGEFIRGILKWYFAGTYRLAQTVARASRCSGLPYLGYFLLITTIASWVGALINYFFHPYEGDILLALFWDLILWLRSLGWLWGSVVILTLIWGHYFLVCLALSSWGLGKKFRKMKMQKVRLDKSNAKDILGLDLIRAREIEISEIDHRDHLQVLGSGVRARNLLQKFLEADLKRGRQVLIFAPDSENLLEEVTYSIRERASNEVRSFFYFSLNRPDISASYTLLYVEAFKFLQDCLKLPTDGREAAILERIMKSLAKIGKPYELDDLLLLLRDKRAAAVLNEIELTREYLWNFDSLKKHRDSLAEKLSKFGTKLKLEKYPVTQGFPLNFSDILKFRKHLFVEIGPKKSFFMMVAITHLLYELEKNYRHEYPAIYIIFPEKFEELYPLEEYLKGLKLSAEYRIFSSRFSSLYSKGSRWNSIILPDIPVAELEKPEYKALLEEIRKEKQYLERQSDFESLLNEENFESYNLLIKEIGISTCAGLFSSYKREGCSLDRRLFYVPESEPARLEYEPYQKKFKPEDMLHLRQRIGKIKWEMPKYDVGVLEIIHDLRPKESGSDEKTA